MQEWQAKAWAGIPGTRAQAPHNPRFVKAQGNAMLKGSRTKAQAATETIVVFGISLLIVMAFMSVGLNMISDSARLQSENDAYNSAHDLAVAADEVYAQGEGAFKTVTIRLPQQVVFNANSTFIGKPDSQSTNTSLQPKTIMVNYTTAQAEATTAEPVSGSFPSSSGIYEMRVISRGNYVSINPAVVELSQNSIDVSMSENETRLFTLSFFAVSHDQANVTISSVWSFTDVNCTVSPSQFTAATNGTSAVITLNASVNSSGFYSSTLLVNATAYPSGVSELTLVPLSVDVQAR